MAAGPTKRVNVVIRGRVQGVWFRVGVSDAASAFGVAGWVRNLDDGGVEAEFEGAARAVDATIDWCKVGTAQSSVSDVTVSVLEPLGETAFRIR